MDSVIKTIRAVTPVDSFKEIDNILLSTLLEFPFVLVANCWVIFRSTDDSQMLWNTITATIITALAGELIKMRMKQWYRSLKIFIMVWAKRNYSATCAGDSGTYSKVAYREAVDAFSKKLKFPVLVSIAMIVTCTCVIYSHVFVGVHLTMSILILRNTLIFGIYSKLRAKSPYAVAKGVKEINAENV